MPQINPKFDSGGALEPEDDDISNAYMLSRQVAHEYHSSATQSYIDAESAALQVQQQEAADEQKKFQQKQAEKQATAKGAESEFAETMVESLATRKPEATSSIGKRGAAPVAPEGGGGGWGDNAPEAMPSVSKEVQAEVGGIEAPMVDPTMAASAGAGAAFKLSMSAGKSLMPSLARAVNAGVVNAITDPLYGTAAEVVGANNPALALPFNVLVGIGGGMAFEPMLERAITRASAKIGKAIDPAMMKAVLANESGMVEVWHGSPHKFDKVSHEKIGTGEGAQAFGWGTYYTDKKEIAAHYAKPRVPLDDLKQTYGDAWAAVERYRVGKKDDALKYMDDLISDQEKGIAKWGGSEGERKALESYQTIKKQMVNDEIKFGDPSTYRAQLFPGKDPSEYTFADWYEPVKKGQLSKILLQAKKENIEIKKLNKSDYFEIKKTEDGYGIYGSDKGPFSGKSFGLGSIETIEDANKKLETLIGRHVGNVEDVYKELSRKLGGDKEASAFLKRAGIDGIRYPTETLSGKGPKGGGAYNYVVFDDKDVRLVSRESGGVVDDLTKAAVIEELNNEIKQLSVADILKSQKGELVVRQGNEGQPPAPVKGGVSGTPAPVDEFVGPGAPATMQTKANQFLANTNPDITQETAGNIRLWGADLEPKFMGEIETPEDIMRVITGTHEAFATETEVARRGVRSWEETAEEAKKYKLEDLLGRKQGQALNAEQVDNARTLLVSSADTLRGMAKVVSSGQANDLQKADFMRAFNVHYAIQMQLSGAAAEAGRALQIFRKVATADTLRVGQLRDFIAATADKKITPESIADALSTMTTPAQVSNYVKQAKGATTWDMFIEAWINGLLSGPVTHAVNTTSNALTSIWMLPERALAAGISQLHGGEIRGGEVVSQAYGLVTGAKDGFKLAWQALKTGETSDIMGKIEQQQNRSITAKNVQQLPVINKLAPNALEEGGMAARFVDVLGEAIRVPGRFLGAEDEFFKSIGYRMELHAQAYRTAANEGLEGTAMAQRMQAIVADPQNLAPEVHLAAINAARYQTFTADLGKGGKGIQAAANYIPGAKLVVPFIRTPANIMKFALERNIITAPFFRQVRADIMAGGPRMDMALSRIAMGSMGMAVVGAYAASGAITGGGPSDTDLRAHKYNTGWQPYSIKIGDTYYAYGRLEPLGMMMGLAADAVEIMGELDELESDKLATTIVAAIGKNVMSKTWLRGMSEMINAMEDPDRYGSKYVKQLAGTAIPTGVAQIERTLYPELSDAQSALDAIKARVPGYSNELPTRRNLWGEKITFNGALGPDIVSPIFTSKEKDSPIDKELLRMKSGIKTPNRTQTFEGVPLKLDSYEYEEFMVRMNRMKLDSTGKTLKKSLDNLVTKDRDYKALKSDDQKERMIRGYIEEATQKTQAEMLETNQTLRRLVDDEHRRKAAMQ